MARITGCQRSHDCEDDAVQSYLQQLAVERVIEEEFPDVFDAQFNTWLTEDVRAEHRGRLDPDACFLCRTFVAGRRDARPRAA